MTRRLLASGVIGPVLFVVVFLIEGATRTGYDATHQFVSLLSLSDQGWQQVANFLVTGVLFVLFALGLRRVMSDGPGSRWGPILMGLVGVGMVVAAIFPADAAQGYPPGTPPGLLPATISWHGAVHNVAAGLIFFVALPAASFIVEMRFRRRGRGDWARFCIVSGLAALAVFVATFTLDAVLVGVLQRVAIAIGLGWVAVVAVVLLRELRPESA